MSDYTDRDYGRQFAARGAALLDQRGPVGWYDAAHIDLCILDIHDADRCILAQVYREKAGDDGFLYGLNVLDAFPSSPYGFAVHHQTTHQYLISAWREEILARRARDVNAALLTDSTTDNPDNTRELVTA